MHPMLETHDEPLSALYGAEAVYCPGTAEHSTRVSFICGLLAQALGLGPAETETARWTGVLHDIGKLSVPVKILHKPGRLTAVEWEAVKRHPAVGADLVLGVSAVLAPVAAGIRSHHERWDGSGYPDGLDGHDIPLLGRIAAVSDVFDALTHRREYRQGKFSHREGAGFVLDRAGRDFDPEVVAAFADLDRRGLTVPNGDEYT